MEARRPDLTTVGLGEEPQDIVARLPTPRLGAKGAAAASAYPHRPPRVDADMYQCPVPKMMVGRKRRREGDDLRGDQLDIRDGLIWTPDNSLPEHELNQFVSFCRELTQEQLRSAPIGFNHAQLTSDGSIPSESDEHVLQFLHQLKYDTVGAKFRLMCQAGAGMDATWFKYFTVTEGRRSSNFVTSERRPLVGSHLYLAKHNIWESKSDFDDSSNDVLASTGRSRNADKQELARRWREWMDNADQMLKQGKDGRPASLERLALLEHDAKLMPHPEEMPGEKFVDNVHSMQEALGTRMMKGREWMAGVYDALSGVGPASVTVSQLDGIVDKAKSLPVEVEILYHIQGVVTEAKEWEGRAAKVLAQKTTTSGGGGGAGGADGAGGDQADEPAPAKRGRKSTSSYASSSTSATSNPRGPARVHFRELKSLRRQAETIPLKLTGIGMIDSKISKVESLAQRIKAAFPRKQRHRAKLPLYELRNMCGEIDVLHVIFDEAEVLQKHVKDSNAWTKKAQNAVDGRAELKVLQGLITEANHIPVDLTMELRKLEGQVGRASDWVSRVRKVVPRHSKTRTAIQPDKPHLDAIRKLVEEAKGIQSEVKESTEMETIIATAEEWLGRVHSELGKGEAVDPNELQSLLIESENLPVVLEEQQVVAVEIDVREWSVRSKKAFAAPSTLEEVSRLLEELDSLRSSLPAKFQDTLKVTIETTMRKAVDSAESWQQRAKRAVGSCFTGRNHRNCRRNGEKVPMARVQQLIADAKEIPIDLSARLNFMESGVVETEEWSKTTRQMLTEIGEWPPAKKEDNNDDKKEIAVGGERKRTTLEDLYEQVEQAEKLHIHLEEAIVIEALSERVQAWVDNSKKFKVNGKRRKAAASKPSMAMAQELIAEAPALPVDLDDEVKWLKLELDIAIEWQTQASSLLEQMANKEKEPKTTEDGTVVVPVKEEGGAAKNGQAANSATAANTADATMTDTAAAAAAAAAAAEEGSSNKVVNWSHPDLPVEKMEDLLERAAEVCICTDEEQSLERYVELIEWTRETEAMFTAGKKKSKLVDLQDLVERGARIEGASVDQLNHARSQLEICEACVEKAKEMLGTSTGTGSASSVAGGRGKAGAGAGVGAGEEGGMQMQMQDASAIQALLSQLSELPVRVDEEKKLQAEIEKSQKWQAQLREALSGGGGGGSGSSSGSSSGGSSGGGGGDNSNKKLTVEAMQKLVREAEKTRVQSDELSRMQGHLAAANEWLKKVERSGIEKGEADISTLEALLKEAQTIPADLSQHTSILQNATQQYCICRLPYEGFMIGCDTCEEWYHGPCVAVTEAQANRCDRYSCPRCLIKQDLQSLLSEAVAAVGFALSPEAGLKHRQKAHQKALRKMKKEEKTKKEAEALGQRLRMQLTQVQQQAQQQAQQLVQQQAQQQVQQQAQQQQVLALAQQQAVVAAGADAGEEATAAAAAAVTAAAAAVAAAAVPVPVSTSAPPPTPHQPTPDELQMMQQLQVADRTAAEAAQRANMILESEQNADAAQKREATMGDVVKPWLQRVQAFLSDFVANDVAVGLRSLIGDGGVEIQIPGELRSLLCDPNVQHPTAGDAVATTLSALRAIVW